MEEQVADGVITKVDDDKRLVFGWASIIKDVEGKVLLDRQDDFIDDEEELEKAAYTYVLHSRDGGEMHVRTGVSTMVESVVLSKEKQAALGIPEGVVPVGWWIGFKVNDDRVWDQVKKGDYMGFSVHGTGQRQQTLLKDDEFTDIEKAACPTATSVAQVNIRNRELAKRDANYRKATTAEKCGNCKAYDQSAEMMKCISDGGLTSESAMSKREVGYCKSLEFMCASSNTCDGWVGSVEKGCGCAECEGEPAVRVSKRLLSLMSKAQKSKGANKIATVMREFKEGKLKSSTGDKVTDAKQAMAIALSEQRQMEKGDYPGHPFRGNQWTGGKPGQGTKRGAPRKAKGAKKVARPGSVDAAMARVKSGKTAELKSPKDVAVFLEEFNKEVQAMKKAGKEAKNLNLCKVTVPGTNLFCGSNKGIPRNQMPQIGGKPVKGSKADKLPKNDDGEVDGSEEFIKHLEGKGIKVTDGSKKASSLKASQTELVGAKVAGMAAAEGFDPGKKPIFVSRDGYVIDGHHRWAAVVGRDTRDGKLGDLEMNVRVVDMDIMDVLKEANSWADDFGIKQKAAQPSE